MSYKHITYENMQTFSEELKAKYAKQTDVTALGTRVTALEDAGGEPNVLEGVKVNGTALSIAEKMVDVLIATGTTDGTIAVNGADVAVKGLAALAYKANVSEADLDTALAAVIAAKAESTDVTALTAKVTTLIGEDADKSARAIAAEELAAQLIPENAQESLDTLQEIAAWIQSHPDDAAAMNTAITNLTALVGTLPEDATSTNVVDYIAEAITAIGIGDYAKTSEVTSAISTALEDYYTKTDADSTFVKSADIETVTEDEMKALLADETESA